MIFTCLFSVAKFRPDPARLQLVSSANDYKVRVWDLTSSECVAIVDAHYSVVTSLDFSPDGKTMYRSVSHSSERLTVRAKCYK